MPVPLSSGIRCFVTSSRSPFFGCVKNRELFTKFLAHFHSPSTGGFLSRCSAGTNVCRAAAGFWEWVVGMFLYLPAVL